MRADRAAGGHGGQGVFKATVLSEHTQPFNVKQRQIELERIELLKVS